MTCAGCGTIYDPEIAAMGIYVSVHGVTVGDPHQPCPHKPCAFACDKCYPELSMPGTS